MISWMKLELLLQIQRIRPAQPEARRIYVNTLKASNSAPCRTMVAEFVLGFLDSLRENLLELSENKLGYSSSLKDQMLNLHEELRFLEFLAADSPCKRHTDREQKFNDLCEHNNILIIEVAYVIYSFYDDENEDMASERNSLASDLLAKLKVAKDEARQLYDKLVPKSLRSNFPRTNARVSVWSILRNLKELLSSKAHSIAPLKHNVEVVLEGLLSLNEDFCEFEKHLNEQEELEDHWTRFKDVAYHTECVIDSFLAKDGEIWFHKLGLFDVNEEIKTIKTGFNQVRRKMADESRVLKRMSSFSNQISLQTHRPEDKLVVFEHECEKIKGQLTSGSEKLRILSIVGMPGIGKTTLANFVFHNSSVIYHFHVRASCCVSQAYDLKRLLVEILQTVTNQTLDNNHEDLEQKLYQSLKGRRYLIFLDDIWDLKLLENMRLSFPDDGNGSRIMLTSRLNNIASTVGAECVMYHLSPLSSDKSWEMLQFMLFGKESCPQELVGIGRKIAGSCRGLPLTINLIAGILREIDRKQDCWLQLAETLSTEFVDDPEGRCRKALDISYKHLPNHLRPCFLYFGAFPEDERIPAKRLGLLWIAEGFVQLPENDERCLEDIADTYLDELISRNLIMVSARGSLGGVRENYIHDLLHDFAIAKAMEERFLLPVNHFSDFSTLSSESYPWIEQYRLCIYHGYFAQFSHSNPSGPHVRSLVYSHRRDNFRGFPNLLSNFKILRVFSFPRFFLPRYHSLIELIHMKFLALEACQAEEVSAILHCLQNLETLIIKEVYADETFRIKNVYPGEAAQLSLKDIDSMAKMRFLRHFEVPFAFPPISQGIFEKHKPIGFESLHYLSTPLLRSEEDKFMRLMPNLRTLKYFDKGSTNLSSSQKLDFLKNLESLKIDGWLKAWYTEYPTLSILSYPPYLKKLTLARFYLPWTNISAIGKLEHLEVLKFRYLKSSTNIWDMAEFGQQFPKLKVLELKDLNIKEWNASLEDFPFLERLQVLFCQDLKELPSCLADIPTLKEITVANCPISLGISAKKIEEEQVEVGNEELVIKVYL